MPQELIRSGDNSHREPMTGSVIRCTCCCPESTHTGPGSHCIEPFCRDEPCTPISERRREQEAQADTEEDDLRAELECRDAEIAQLRARVEDWKTAAGAGMRLADELRAERDALAAGGPLICSDERHKTKVFALQVILERVQAACVQLPPNMPDPIETAVAHTAGWNDAMDKVQAALTRAGAPTKLHGGRP